MNAFAQVEDGIVILLIGGVFSQVDMYQRGDGIYAQHGKGYISLRRNGTTSNPKVRWEDHNMTPVWFDRMGRMVIREPDPLPTTQPHPPTR